MMASSSVHLPEATAVGSAITDFTGISSAVGRAYRGNTRYRNHRRMESASSKRCYSGPVLQRRAAYVSLCLFELVAALAICPRFTLQLALKILAGHPR
jgi:hypothetical protein